MSAEAVQLAGLSMLAVLLVGAAGWLLVRRRGSAAERERKRRRLVHLKGRMGDAVITDIRGHVLDYRYEVRGVAYAASQDVAALADRLPEDPAQVIGQAALKYHPGNPANSIVVCEEWSGFRPARQDHPLQLTKGD